MTKSKIAGLVLAVGALAALVFHNWVNRKPRALPNITVVIVDEW